jgi:two-component system, cell cycle sensor histidine kinase and response regulator CckA
VTHPDTERPPHDAASSVTSASDTSASDTSASDTSGSDTSASDTSGSEALARSERRFRLAVQASGSLVYEWHLATGAVEWFGDVDAALGLPPGGLPRTLDGWANVLHPQDRGFVMATMTEAARTREPFTVSYRVVRADGSVGYWREHGLAMPGDAPADAVFIGACTDVTTQRLSDDAVRQTQRLEAIAALAGGMAHDVNNLLSIVKGYGELLRDELEGRAVGINLLDEVMQAVDRTGSLTRHLLAFSRRQLLRLQPVALGPWMRTIESGVRALLPAEITLQCEVAEDTPTVMLDAAAFERVMRQLATNAHEAMPNGGTVRMAASRNTRGDAVITVRDSGRGIPPDLHGRIVEPFFTTKAEARGAGLGLSSAFGTVQQHGGTLTVESAEGAGTTIVLTLPAALEPVVTATPAAEASRAAPSANGELVLVVEDDTVFAMLMRRLLVDLGYTVMLAGSVQAAIQQVSASTRPVQLVITDMIMPGGSGRDLANYLAISHPTVPVLFMSGYSARQLERTAAGRPAAGGLLEKPFTQETLARAVRDALASVRPAG